MVKFSGTLRNVIKNSNTINIYTPLFVITAVAWFGYRDMKNVVNDINFQTQYSSRFDKNKIT